MEHLLGKFSVARNTLPGFAQPINYYFVKVSGA